jgi:hypothetical protein
MPKGKQRTPDEIRAELKARQARIENRLIQLDRKTAATARKNERNENLELGALVRIVLDSDMGVKRKLVEVAGTQSLKSFQRKVLERVLGRLPVKVAEDGAQAAE